MKTKTLHCSVCGKTRRCHVPDTGMFELKGEGISVFCSIECGKKFIEKTYFSDKCAVCGKHLTKKYYIPGQIRYDLCRDYFCKKCGEPFLNVVYRPAHDNSHKCIDGVALNLRVWNTKHDEEMKKEMISSLIPYIVPEELR